MNLILPSLLAAPTLHLKDALDELITIGLTDFHIDIMDYHYTPNFGLSIHHLEDIISAYPQSKIDVHLMTQPTQRSLLEQLIHLGIEHISVHTQTLSKPDLDWLKTQKIQLRVALNPNEPIPKDLISDQVLILCVNPGFSHQKFQETQLLKIKQAKALGLDVMVDGGVNLNNISSIMQHKPDHLVIGSGLFKRNLSERQDFINLIKDLQG